MMPNISGIDVCRKIREKSYVPILFLTAKSLETDKMEALSAGGDDYLVKPFSYLELIARIQALIRRCRVYDNADVSDTTASSTIERCGLTLYTKCNNVSYDGRQLALIRQRHFQHRIYLKASGMNRIHSFPITPLWFILKICAISLKPAVAVPT